LKLIIGSSSTFSQLLFPQEKEAVQRQARFKELVHGVSPVGAFHLRRSRQIAM